MAKFGWQVRLGLGLIILSILLYAIDILAFRDPYHVAVYLLGELAFLPISVLFVTVFIDRILRERERQERLEKMNMVIGVFFSEVGTTLIRMFSECDPNADELRAELSVSADWSDKEFQGMIGRLRGYEYGVDIACSDLMRIKKFLIARREFMLGLLENPNLLEHESFTDLLRAVFHLTEELEYRGDIRRLPKNDLEHLSGDLKRAYSLIIIQWLMYMQHLKSAYPYLFSLAIRTNPLKKECNAEVC
jgi:hypothetical protein